MLHELASTASESLAQSKDDIIMDVFIEYFGAGVSVLDCKGRISYRNVKDTETLFFDGKAVLIFYPLESEYFGNVITFKQKWRKLL